MDPQIGKDKGILGWLIELNKHDDIRNSLSQLLNLVIEQIHDREKTVGLPTSNNSILFE